MRILASLAIAGLLAAIICPGDAQAQSRSRGVGRALRADPAVRRRGPEPYGTPRGSSGTIQWNTPNASGNLGGPGAGGGGGGGA